MDIPIDNACCSCKLTRVRSRLQDTLYPQQELVGLWVWYPFFAVPSMILFLFLVSYPRDLCH